MNMACYARHILSRFSIMKLAIHQPEFMPWPGFFNLMALSDLYIVLDHVQFKKRYFENRNQLVSPSSKTLFVGVPVITKNRYYQSICEVEIDNSQNWKKKLLLTIFHNYKKSPYFSKYYNNFCFLIEKKQYNRLLDLNMEIIVFLRQQLKINTPMICSSEFDLSSVKGSELILKLCLLTNTKVYLSGKFGRNYLKVEHFKSNGIQIKWIDYETPFYKQQCNNFVKSLSVLDLLFNHGENSYKILSNNTFL